jgi:hypothetical protein
VSPRDGEGAPPPENPGVVELHRTVDELEAKYAPEVDPEERSGSARSPDWHHTNRDGETVFPGDGAPADAAALADAPLQALNEEYFVIREGGKHFVAMKAFDPAWQREVLVRFNFSQFSARFPGAVIVRGQKAVPLPKAWLHWKGRRQYLAGVTFDPSGAAPPNPGVYNLWNGWPVEPKKGDWSVVRRHIAEVICSGDRKLEKYVIGWLCRMVQTPGEPGGVVLVLRGEEGAGKSLFGTAISRMFGPHAMAISSPRALVGQFNAHLRDLVFLLANEAIYAGDHAAVSHLKALITDETIAIEAKGIDVAESRNFLHILMTTNSAWAVPVALADRRFAVLDVSSSRVGDRAYFDALGAAVKDDGVIAAMLHDLLAAPIGNFEVRDIPSTRARDEQKQHSLEGAEAWLAHVLVTGDLGIPGPNVGGWPEWASTSDLQLAHEAWGRGARFREVVSPSTLGKTLRRFFKPERPWNAGGRRPPGYRLGTLAEARARFCEVTGLSADAEAFSLEAP